MKITYIYRAPLNNVGKGHETEIKVFYAPQDSTTMYPPVIVLPMIVTVAGKQIRSSLGSLGFYHRVTRQTLLPFLLLTV